MKMEFPPDEIVAELEEAKLKPIKVFPDSRLNDETHRDNLYLVHLEKGSTTMADLQKVRSLFDIIVEWERYKPKRRGVTQCTNCLAFGHGTRNCHMHPRCGKCAERHSTDDCQHMEEGSDPKCANCGANHEGNSRNCPKRAEYMDIRKKASSRNQRGRERRPPPPMTEQHFPSLRYNVPNLPPLQPNQRQATRPPPPSVQPRLAAAAAAPTKPSTTAWGSPGPSVSPPGWGNIENKLPPTSDVDDELYTPEQMMEFVRNMYRALHGCRSKEQQLEASTMVLLNFVTKYGP